MRKTKEILRLKFEAGLGNHKIGRALGISASTVWEALMRASAAGITWPLPEEMTEGELERREALEQLRALEHGFRIKVVVTPHDSVEVDTPAELERVRRILTGRD